MDTDDSVKEGVDVPVGPVKGEDVDTNFKIDDEHKDTIGITCTNFFIYSYFVSLVTKRDLSTNIGFHIMKVDIGRNGELIPKDKSGYEHAEKVYIPICLLLQTLYTLLDTLSIWRCICNGKC